MFYQLWPQNENGSNKFEKHTCTGEEENRFELLASSEADEMWSIKLGEVLRGNRVVFWEVVKRVRNRVSVKKVSV